MLARLLWFLIVLRLGVAVGIAYWLVSAQALGWGAAIAIGVLVPVLLHGLLLASQFALARWRASPVPDRLALTTGGALRLFAEEWWVSLRSFTCSQPLFGARAVASAAAPGVADRLPVLFVHGFFCNRAVWRPLARTLARRGHVTGAVNLEPVFGSIDDYVEAIADGIRELQARTGDEQIALVGHSMGGIAIRAYLRARGIEEVARVVTLGTPHRGTVHARFGLSQNVKQMRLDGPWLTDLSRTEWPSVRRLFTIVFSHHDNLIAPQALQTLSDARVVELGGVAHLAMLERPAVHEIVAAALVR